MARLWFVLAAALLLAIWIEYRDWKLIERGRERKEAAVTCLLILVLGFFCGLRTWGNDTVTYLQIFDQMPLWDEFLATYDFNFAKGIGFQITTCLIKSVGFSRQDYLMIFAVATIIPYVLFVRRYSTRFVFGVFLMFATGFYTFSMAAIKQTMAVGICLCALPYVLDRQWIKFGLIIGLASMFHPYAVIYLVAPLMTFQPLKGKTALYVCVFVMAGIYLEQLIGSVLDVTDMMGVEYTEEEMLGAGVNFFRVLVSFIPLLLAWLCDRTMFENAGEDVNLMFNLSMLNALIMFVGMFGTANYFARLANYFLPAQVVILPWVLSNVHHKERGWLMPCCVVGYLGYFYYENAIIRPFDTSYTQMPFWEYIVSLF